MRSHVAQILIVLPVFWCLCDTAGAQQTALGSTSNMISETEADEAQGLAARSLDWLSKQVTQPADTDTDKSFSLFSSPNDQRKAIKTGATVTLVICLFLLFMFVLRMRGSGSSKGLPGEILSVLGQTQLGPNQRLQLIRLGSKVLLVSTTQNGSQTLGEITDPAEVLQIESVCRSGRWPNLPNRKRSAATTQGAAPQSTSILGSGQTPIHSGGQTLLEA